MGSVLVLEFEATPDVVIELAALAFVDVVLVVLAAVEAEDSVGNVHASVGL